MSDPMTNFEIEDVLSSIRRLVADGDPSQATSAGSEVANKVGKLVLTPALRVDSRKKPDAGAPALLLKKPLPETDAKPAPATDRVSLLATITELEAAVRDQPDDWEPDGTGTDTELSWARAGFRGDVEVEDIEDLDKAAPRVSAPESTSAWPPTLSEAAKRYGSVGDEVDQRDEVVAEAPQFRHHRVENVAPIEDTEEDFHDDLIGGSDLDDDPEAMLDSYLADDPIIDEALLRDMVRDIVRQELQGKLGERITRNVRKLVRREIHRVLTTQEFD